MSVTPTMTASALMVRSGQAIRTTPPMSATIEPVIAGPPRERHAPAMPITPATISAIATTAPTKRRLLHTLPTTSAPMMMATTPAPSSMPQTATALPSLLSATPDLRLRLVRPIVLPVTLSPTGTSPRVASLQGCRAPPPGY